MGLKPAKEKPSKMVGAVAQSFRILRLLARATTPLGVSVIARDAQVNPSTAFNILRTLVFEDIVDFDQRSKSYKLSRGLLDLSHRLLHQSIVEDIRSELNRIASETNCLVGIWKADEGRFTLLERAIGHRPIRLDMDIKQRLPFFGGAMGRAYAAHISAPDETLRKKFHQLRWAGKIDVETYIAEVRAAQKLGYAVDNEALYPGVVTVGTVLTDHEGKIVYGLTASDIAHILSADKIKALGEDMASISRAFSLPR